MYLTRQHRVHTLTTLTLYPSNMIVIAPILGGGGIVLNPLSTSSPAQSLNSPDSSTNIRVQITTADIPASGINPNGNLNFFSSTPAQPSIPTPNQIVSIPQTITRLPNGILVLISPGTSPIIFSPDSPTLTLSGGHVISMLPNTPNGGNEGGGIVIGTNTVTFSGPTEIMRTALTNPSASNSFQVSPEAASITLSPGSPVVTLAGGQVVSLLPGAPNESSGSGGLIIGTDTVSFMDHLETLGITFTRLPDGHIVVVSPGTTTIPLSSGSVAVTLSGSLGTSLLPGAPNVINGTGRVTLGTNTATWTKSVVSTGLGSGGASRIVSEVKETGVSTGAGSTIVLSVYMIIL